MSSEAILSLRGIGKAYPIVEKPHQQLLHALAPSLRRRRVFHALRDVSFDVHRGEAIGVIGRNGSGKSTLLQIIAGILQPTSGSVYVRARIAALLELGAGFNPLFSGRENARLNASLLGLSAVEIDARMDQILAFAEIGDYVEQPVKTYSSGMFMRLAFAVAAHTDPDVLIVDEALSVGDVYFQRKCFKRIEQMRQRGCTLLFVTHATDSVVQLCERGIVLDRGRLVFDGGAGPAVKAYLRKVFGDHSATNTVGVGHDANAADGTEAQDEAAEIAAFEAGGAKEGFHMRPGYNADETRVGNGRATTADCLISSSAGLGPTVPSREPFRVLVRYHFPTAIDRVIFGMRLRTPTGLVVYSSNTLISGGQLYTCEGGTTALVAFDLRCSLVRGPYFLTVGVSRLDEDGSEIHALDRRIDAMLLVATGAVGHAEGIAELEAAFSVSCVEGSVLGA